ncbi:MAG: deoxyribodipyrimidine photo-lyase, partial [Phycisphaerales bacterium]
MTARAIWWVRRDMRLDDNGALLKAAKAEAMLAVYVHAQAEEGEWPLGGAQKWWLARSLAALDASLKAAGSRLVILDGEAAKVLVDLARKIGATEVVWSRRFEPAALAQERRVEAALDAAGIAWSGFNTNRLFDPEEIATKEGRPYQVYTPFSRACRARAVPAQPRSAPAAQPSATGA